MFIKFDSVNEAYSYITTLSRALAAASVITLFVICSQKLTPEKLNGAQCLVQQQQVKFLLTNGSCFQFFANKFWRNI